MLIKGTNYEPKTIDDIVFGNDEARLRIEDIIHNIEEIPSNGKSAILLYGAYGTGKTTLAKMLPDNIEYGKTNGELVWPSQFIACQQGFNGPQVLSQIQSLLDLSSLNDSKLHYIIIDEVDNLTKQAQQSLKSALNTTRAVFILTTNNVSELDRGLLDRCVLIEMNAAKPDQYLKIAKSIVSDFDVEIADEELLPTINGANGSFRNLIHNVSRLARRKASSLQHNVIY